jgi:DNA processing protein
MTPAPDSAALVALLRLHRRPWAEYAQLVEEAGGARPALDRELTLAEGQATLLPEDPAPMLARAETEIRAWRARGFQLVSVLDAGYPQNLRMAHDRPPLIFVAGSLRPEDARSVAVIGSRRASEAGRSAAAGIAGHLVTAGFVVVSGLAAGIDTAAHNAALAAGGRTVAVIGTGLAQSYPPANASLQRRIADECAVVSQFWPETPPSRETFPMRNAVMSALALGTVIVEASMRSGALVQARFALAQGRPVFVLRSLLAQAWAQKLAQRPGVHIVDDPEQITATIERLNATDALVE